jgi:sugar phosphate isomerase/epimerase
MPPLFPITIISDEISQELDRLLAFVAEFRLDGFELRSIFGRAFKDLTASDIRRIARRVKAANTRVVGCASPVFKCDIGDASEIDRHLDIFKRSVEHAVNLDCNLVRVFTFLRLRPRSRPDDLRRAADFFGRLLAEVRGTPVRIGVENESTAIVGSGPELRDFLALVTAAPVGGIYDPCNSLFVEGVGDAIRDDFPAVPADRLLHIHLKDARRVNGRLPDNCCEMGKGEVDFDRLFRELRKHHYPGCVSLETHWRDVPLTGDQQHLPGGNDFSQYAEPASRTCVRNIIAIMRRIRTDR